MVLTACPPMPCRAPRRSIGEPEEKRQPLSAASGPADEMPGWRFDIRPASRIAPTSNTTAQPQCWDHSRRRLPGLRGLVLGFLNIGLGYRSDRLGRD